MVPDAGGHGVILLRACLSVGWHVVAAFVTSLITSDKAIREASSIASKTDKDRLGI